MTPSRKTVSPAGLALIRAHEGFSPAAYRCPAGKRTIGYGHVLRPGETLSQITSEQGEALLRADVAPIEIYLNGVFPGLTQNQFDALVSFCFNVGLGAFERSTLFSLLKDGDLSGAARQFGRWTHANGKALPGLVKRRAAERQLFQEAI